MKWKVLFGVTITFLVCLLLYLFTQLEYVAVEYQWRQPHVTAPEDDGGINLAGDEESI